MRRRSSSRAAYSSKVAHRGTRLSPHLRFFIALGDRKVMLASLNTVSGFIAVRKIEPRFGTLELVDLEKHFWAQNR